MPQAQGFVRRANCQDRQKKHAVTVADRGGLRHRHAKHGQPFSSRSVCANPRCCCGVRQAFGVRGCGLQPTACRQAARTGSVRQRSSRRSGQQPRWPAAQQLRRTGEHESLHWAIWQSAPRIQQSPGAAAAADPVPGPVPAAAPGVLNTFSRTSRML